MKNDAQSRGDVNNEADSVNKSMGITDTLKSPERKTDS